MVRTVNLDLGSFPSQVVKDVSTRGLRGSSMGSCDSNRSKSVYQDTRPATIIEQFDPALDVLAAAMMDGCPDPA